jgi:hypothetical protein
MQYGLGDLAHFARSSKQTASSTEFLHKFRSAAESNNG